jgi:threonine/homoserine/homoserine lactone efflux protein
VLVSYLAAAAVLALLAVVPGPDVAVVSRAALARGRAAGIQAAAGVVSGLLVWGLLTVAGLAAVLAASPEAYTVVKLAGAAYLTAMGVRALWRSRRGAGPSAASGGTAGSDPFRAGLLANLLNPKIAVFYTSALPALVPRGVSADGWLALLVGTHAMISLFVLWLYAGLAGLARPRVRRALERVTGIALVAFGLRVAAAAR